MTAIISEFLCDVCAVPREYLRRVFVLKAALVGEPLREREVPQRDEWLQVART